MKKVMSLMLGLSLMLGAASVFAQDKAPETKTEKKARKKGTAKKKKSADPAEKKG